MNRLLLVVLTLSMVVSCGHSAGFCQGKNDTLYPDPTNCVMYYSCYESYTYHLYCPEPLAFNGHMSQCDWPINVNCSLSVTSPVLEDTTEPHPVSLPVRAPAETRPPPVATTLPPETTPDFEIAALTLANDILQETVPPRKEPSTTFCENLADGIYADPEYCDAFYHCHMGYTYYKFCPGALLFNPDHGACEWDYQVDCTGREYPSTTQRPSGFPRTTLPATNTLHETNSGQRPASASETFCDRVVCYYPNWAIYRNGARFGPGNIDPTLCTHIIYAFAKLNGNTLAAGDPLDEPIGSDIGNFARVTNLKQTHPELKVLLAVGGWTMGSVVFSSMASSAQGRSEFVNSAITFLRERNFDGLDFDWEYPANRGSPPGDKELHAMLLEELRRAFDAEASGEARLLLTGAVAAGKTTIDSAYDVPRVSRAVDFLNVMTYDLHGAWDSVTGHNSPLYAGSWETSYQATLNVAWVANYWVTKGAPKEKLAIGIPLYARSYTLRSASNSAVGAPISGSGRPGRYTSESGILSYYEVCSLFGSSTKYFIESQHVPFLVSGDQWVGYDDPSSVKERVRFIRENGYGGVMIWDLSHDDFGGQFCGQGSFPLMHAINDECAVNLA